MTEPTAKAADCEHFFATHILGGEPLSVRVCQFCRMPDWADLREQLDVVYGGNEAALTRVFGDDRTASVIAHTLNAHGHAIERVRCMTDAELLAIPGVGETSLARIRAAIPAPEPEPSDPAECSGEAGPCPEHGHHEHSLKQPGEAPTIGTARIALDVQPGLADGIASVELANGIVLPAVEFEGADVLPLKGTPMPARLVLTGDERARFTVEGKRYATSAEHPVIVEPIGPGAEGGLVTFTLLANKVTVNGKEVGDVR